MIVDHWAVPITSTDGKLLGMELRTRANINGCPVIIGRGRESKQLLEDIHTQQVREIERKADWFQEHNLFCVLTTQTDSRAGILPFLKYFTTDNNSSEKIWVDEVGADLSSTLPLVAGVVEVARLDRRFTDEHINRDIFPIILKNLLQYCEKVIVPVQDRYYLSALRRAGVWAIQGEYKPICFNQCEQLIAAI